MKVTIYAYDGKVEADVLGSGAHQFVSLELGDLNLFFRGFGQDNVDAVREVIEKLTVAMEQLQDHVFSELLKPEPEPEVHASTPDSDVFDDTPSRRLSTTERHQLQADNGQDTREEARGER